jgi:hypothetical protein
MENLLENAAATAQTNANDSSSNTRPTVMTVPEFCKMKKFVELIPKVRFNSNEYPFITFLTADNKAENIYFTVNSSDTVHEGQDLRDIANDLQIVLVTYTDGRESRAKLSRKSSSRLTIEDLF